ncbi:MAG: hypothetical protein F7C38_03830 [Desulfurococcales archaeon]|nr:hypothetical protein [Desulfurococcales archaeon]
MEESEVKKEYYGKARIGKVMSGMQSIVLKPEDLSSPVAFQMALSRIMEAAMKIAESGGPRPRYVAEVRFTDDLGNNVVFAVDLGENVPPFSSDRVRARVVVELYDVEEE